VTSADPHPDSRRVSILVSLTIWVGRRPDCGRLADWSKKRPGGDRGKSPWEKLGAGSKLPDSPAAGRKVSQKHLR